jgi:membrane-associated phospholipid phosphatase
VAAMPSLHAACPMLICLFFWNRLHRPWAKALLVLYVPAMAFTLVYTGEHYVIDIFVGWAYAIVVYVVGTKILDRRERAKAAKAAAAAGAGPDLDLTDDAAVPAG